MTQKIPVREEWWCRVVTHRCKACPSSKIVGGEGFVEVFKHFNFPQTPIIWTKEGRKVGIDIPDGRKYFANA